SSGDGASNNADIYEINLTTGVTTFKKELSLATDSEGITYAADGLFYTEEDQGSSGEGRSIFTVDLSDGSMMKAATFSGTADAESLACNAGERTDMGDLPDTYGYAVHSVPVFETTANTMYLGNSQGDDDNGKQNNSEDALGDDTDGGDDDDGVTLQGVSISDKVMEKSGSYLLDIQTNEQHGHLNAWFDWNRDGDFDDAGEHIAQEVVGDSNITTVRLDIPTTISTGAVYSRFRYSSDTNLHWKDDIHNGGWAGDGEVEDYRIYVDNPTVDINKTSVTTHTPVEAGDQIDYSITVSNPSEVIPLDHIEIKDPVPEGTSYIDGTATITYWDINDSNFLDTISSVGGYSNNDGNVNWETHWSETGDDNDPAAGDIQIVTDPDIASREVIKIINVENLIQREADLSNYSRAILSFDYRRDNGGAVDTAFFVEISSDGGSSWTELTSIKIDKTDSSYVTYIRNIAAYISADTVVRFGIKAIADTDDIIYIDNVNIEVYERNLITETI
ncbi:MAG: GEVED domain-containing protein, partial [Candidatus Cloacimonadota bacterium]|nr:GEVED domain-containing protein [Candidatus Cloacimonadota bacterium]